MMKVIHLRSPSFDSPSPLMTTVTLDSSSSSSSSSKNGPTVPERRRSATGLTAFGDLDGPDETEEEDQVEDEEVEHVDYVEEVEDEEVGNRVHGGRRHDTLAMCAGDVNGGTSCTSRSTSTSTLPSPRPSSHSNSNNAVSIGFESPKQTQTQTPPAFSASTGGRMIRPSSYNSLRGSSVRHSSTSTTSHSSMQIQMRQDLSSRSIYTDGPPSFPSQPMSPTPRTRRKSSASNILALGGGHDQVDRQGNISSSNNTDSKWKIRGGKPSMTASPPLGTAVVDQQRQLLMAKTVSQAEQPVVVVPQKPTTSARSRKLTAAGSFPPSSTVPQPVAVVVVAHTPTSVRSRKSRSSTTSSSSSKSKLSQQHHQQQGVGGGSSSLDVLETEKQVLTEDLIYAFYDEYFTDQANNNAMCHNGIGHLRETWEIFYEHYYAEDFELIRPSGNTIAIEAICDMYTSKDFLVHSFILVSIDKIRILTGGQTALVCVTTDQSFTYKGNYNEDRVIFSVVMELRDGKAKIVHEHRTTGRPIPKQSRWDTTETS